ncbi:BREX system P-loop protein BrxC [Flavobacteriaceae bacterium]|nr:BREX system P-loop protein BrxC [Flavobacteriaceae bacterium]
MKINSIFLKNINRNIETVIKADDRDHISDEVAEYVITSEISKKIRDLFGAYNSYSGANGVWISGFFGSGKSHLLKILSYVLENKEFDGYSSGDLFAEKIEDDQMLKGDVVAASKIPSESILFNIDQQAQITSKEDANAILEVFYKVFYDHLGYYGFIPHVAEFEMWLDDEGILAEFKEKFKIKSGNEWEGVRKNYFDITLQKNLSAVLGDIKNVGSEDYIDILDKLEENHKQSIEDFCNRVQQYISKQERGFRLNFFVDEVGQYISDNTKLMLNLQTIAESLATKTKGSSWILVTSQEDMEAIVGDMNKSQQNDFSRIQARFKIKIPLTSANVDEVVEKRLLKKNDSANSELKKVYSKESEHLRTIYSFSDAGVQFKGFKDDKDFINKFPFLPYQFELFQQCRRALSTHNAFQGKHSSVGERSMLGVFQQVTQKLGDSELSGLVSFDRMFEGIRNELKGEIQSSILVAENNLGSPFAIRVLKTLFMVKYYNSFKTTKRNVSVLLIDTYSLDLKQHDKDIDQALNLLENQSYIQRNGELYEFLTDDEKDVEQEIKEVDADDQAVNQLLKEILFDEIIRDNKIKFEENKQDYKFTSKIDGAVLGREEELGVEIITPNYHYYVEVDEIARQTMGLSTMRLLMPEDGVFIKDAKMYIRTNKYIKQNQSTSLKSERKRILHDKAVQNNERKSNLVILANQLLGRSDIYINGSLQEISATTDGKSKVIKGFQILVKTVYPNLRMLGNHLYSEETIRNIILSTQDDLFGTDDNTISEAENELINIINRRKGQSDRTSLNDLKNHFGLKPYGWYPNAVWSMVARLYKRGKIEIKQDSNLLEDSQVVNALLVSSNYGNTLVVVQEDVDPKLIRELKTLFTDAFDENCPYQDAKDIALGFKEKLGLLLQEVTGMVQSSNTYPFLKLLESIRDKLRVWSGKEYSFFLTNRGEFEDVLLDTKEDLLDPIRRFMNSDQKKIYDEIHLIVTRDTTNLSFIDGDEIDQLKEVLSNDKPFLGTTIRDAKSVMDTLKEKVLNRIKTEKETAVSNVESIVEHFKNKSEFSKLNDSQKEDILSPFVQSLKEIKEERFISNIRNLVSNVQNRLETQQLTKLQRLTSEGQDQFEYIKANNIKVSYDKRELKTNEDVDQYIETLREKYKEQISKNRRISL